MLKRIKETLTCTDSGGKRKSRIIYQSKLKSHHLLHSDKSTYFYKSKLGNIKNILYSSKISTIPLVLSAFGLLLVLGLSVGCVGAASGIDAYAEGEDTIETTAATTDACTSEDAAVALDMSGDLSLSKTVDDDITNNAVSYISKDFTVTTCKAAEYKIYAQANSSKLQNTEAPDALGGVGENVQPNNFTTNTWGYAVDLSTTANTSLSYNTMPEATETKSAAYSSRENANTTTNLKIVFAAKFGNDKVAGHYTSDVLLSTVAEPKNIVTYSLSYNGNGSTGGIAPTAQTKESLEDSEIFTVASAGDLMKSGYTFAGWAETSDATTAQYQPGGQIELTFATPSKTLYAVWDSIAPVNTWNELKYMQQMTPAACNTANGEKTLIDSRDRTTYTVKKLSDNKCWMTQNLRIVDKSITSADSDVTSNYTIPASSDPWDNEGANTNKVYYAGNTTHGAYYTWYAATAGTSNGISSGNASSSICPKGWRLPTGGSGGEFEALNNLYPNGTSGTGKKNPGWDNTNKGTWFGAENGASGGTFLPASGIVYFGSYRHTNEIGTYWSSKAYNDDNAYVLTFNSSEVNPTYLYGYAYGLSVRCVAR